MTDTALMEKTEVVVVRRDQYRTSADAVHWTEWTDVPDDLNAIIDWEPFVQVRVWRECRWKVSRVYTWDWHDMPPELLPGGAI